MVLGICGSVKPHTEGVYREVKSGALSLRCSSLIPVTIHPKNMLILRGLTASNATGFPDLAQTELSDFYALLVLIDGERAIGLIALTSRKARRISPSRALHA